MNHPQTKSVVQDVFAALRAHDLDQFRSLLHEEATLRNPATGAVHQGPSAIVETIRPVLQAFPDLTPEIHNLIVDGSQAAVEVQRTGTHTAELNLPDATIPPTHQEVELTECLILVVRENQVVSMTAYTDRQMLTEQLGLEQSAT